MKIDNGKLKIAVQRNGRLSEASLELLQAAGLDLDSSQGRLLLRCRNYPLEVLFLRDDDIPEYVQDGVADLGIVGLNVVMEKGADVVRLDSLGFGACELSIAVPKYGEVKTVHRLEGKRIATSYPRILGKFLEEKKVRARIIEINGSVEITPALDVADAICDLVSTGSTMRLHDLEPIEVLLKSEAVLITNREAQADPYRYELITRLRARIVSHLRARKTKYVMMNAPAEAAERIKAILPGMKSPTIVPLAEKGMIAIHTAVPEAFFWDVIEKLKKAGASDILVVPVEKMVV